MKEKIKSIYILLSILVLLFYTVGCGDGCNHVKMRQVIVEEMSTAEVMPIPDRQWRYLVRNKAGEVWYVEALSNDAEITAKTLIFPGTTAIAEQPVR